MVPADEVDDVVQEVFIKAARSLPEFKGQSKLRTQVPPRDGSCVRPGRIPAERDSFARGLVVATASGHHAPTVEVLDYWLAVST